MNDFERRLLSHVPHLTRYALSLTHDRDDADDLVQDTLLRAVWRQATYRADVNLRGWAMVTMHNIFVTQRIRTGRSPLVVGLECSNAAAHESTDAQRLVAEVADAIEGMPPAFREALLDAAEGKSYAEMSRRMDVPVGTARSRLSRARNALRERFA